MKEPGYSSVEQLPETCGLSISELEAMAARQARQLETQEQLLAAKAQRLRFLKSGGETERLQRLRDKVASQEERLRKLRALRGKVHNFKGTNTVLSSDLESLRAIFNEKEKELSLAVAKVEELTRQLESIRRDGKDSLLHSNGQTKAAIELEKLRKELLYRQKLKEAQATRVAAQRAALSQRREESIRIDRRIAELQERLHRKRILNQQLAASLKSQENVEDFVSLPPTKNDPKYQTLPYNAKLFTPFTNQKIEGYDNFEKSMQSMHIVQPKHQNENDCSMKQPNEGNELTNHNFHQGSQTPEDNDTTSKDLHKYYTIGSIGSIDSDPNKSRGYSFTQKISKNQSTPNIILSRPFPAFDSGNSQRNGITNLNVATSTNSTTTPGDDGSIESLKKDETTNTLESLVHSCSPSPNEQEAHVRNVSSFYQSQGVNKDAFSNDNCSLSSGNGSINNEILAQSSGHTESCSNDVGKPALPPKPSKPAPPPRLSYDGVNPSSLGSQNDGVVESTIGFDRKEPTIKAKPLFVKKNSQQKVVTTGSGSVAGVADTAITSSENLKKNGNDSSNDFDRPTNSNTNNIQSISNNTTKAVRVSINRRIEMPPAFLFPESDPPPSDLIPEINQVPSSSSTPSNFSNSFDNKEHYNLSSTSTSDSSNPKSNTAHFSNYSEHDSFNCDPSASSSLSSEDGNDCNDSAPFIKHSDNHSNNNNNNNSPESYHPRFFAEEYTIPDLFPNGSFHHQRNQHFLLSKINGHNFCNNGSNPSNSSMNLNLMRQLTHSMGHHHNTNCQSNTPSINSNIHHHNNANNCHNSHNINNNNNINDQLEKEMILRMMMMNASNVINNQSISTMDLIREESDDQQLNSESAADSDPNRIHPSSIDLDFNEQQHNLNNVRTTQLINQEAGNHDENGENQQHFSGKGENCFNSDNDHAKLSGIIPVITGSGVARRIKKGNLKTSNKDHQGVGRRVSFDPLALLLDASLEGELELVMKTAREVGNPSAANDEGITALHNAICAGHTEVVRFLVKFGCDVNAPDTDGWTPLHCAASCNNVDVVKFLVEHGACIFATTLSDHETAAEKCEADHDGFGPCSEYLYSIQEKLGIMNGGIVYAVFDYDAQNQDELTFKNGNELEILRKGDEIEREWWWASGDDKQGYVPRNLLGLYPRVKRNGEDMECTGNSGGS